MIKCQSLWVQVTMLINQLPSSVKPVLSCHKLWFSKEFGSSKYLANRHTVVNQEVHAGTSKALQANRSKWKAKWAGVRPFSKLLTARNVHQPRSSARWSLQVPSQRTTLSYPWSFSERRGFPRYHMLSKDCFVLEESFEINLIVRRSEMTTNVKWDDLKICGKEKGLLLPCDTRGVIHILSCSLWESWHGSTITHCRYCSALIVKCPLVFQLSQKHRPWAWTFYSSF